ncbi:hemerythrin domain-containing protein [Streptomyces sp. NPDC056464]|uniref:hemerythrin domain-containing protein n=1 Tax=Streptomyces sp. NPDC056464 TaxID=3345828 RepID=UPI00368A0F8E
MPKIDLYRNVHMGQRARLFTLATELGAADVSDRDSAAEQAVRCLAMTQELREHADHEDTFIHQLLRERSPEAADALDAEHVRLDAAFVALDERARSLPDTPPEALPEAQHRLYLALNEAISAYLAHLHAEETVAMPALWQYAGDEELAAVYGAFRSSRTPEQALTDLRRMLPALPPAPRLAIVRDVVDAATGQPDETLAAVSSTLSPDQRHRLYDDLGVPETRALPA